MQNPFRKLSDIIHVFYYDVPPCIRCGSYITCRYIKLHGDNDVEWQIDESLRHGELVQALDELPEQNCFCAECGCEWIGDVKLRFISKAELQEEKKQRHTIEIMTERIAQEREDRKNDHTMFKSIRRYIGKL